jgi:hypothetical protein
MERKLIILVSGISLVLAVATLSMLAVFVAPSLANTAFAQIGGGIANGASLFQMPCSTRASSQAAGGNTATGITLTGNRVKDAEVAGLAFYAQKYGDKGVTVKATDYGCHVQADVLKNGQVVKSLGYDGAGGVYELN